MVLLYELTSIKHTTYFNFERNETLKKWESIQNHKINENYLRDWLADVLVCAIEFLAADASGNSTENMHFMLE